LKCRRVVRGAYQLAYPPCAIENYRTKAFVRENKRRAQDETFRGSSFGLVSDLSDRTSMHLEPAERFLESVEMKGKKLRSILPCQKRF
jgi:hypothetical protein